MRLQQKVKRQRRLGSPVKVQALSQMLNKPAARSGFSSGTTMASSGQFGVKQKDDDAKAPAAPAAPNIGRTPSAPSAPSAGPSSSGPNFNVSSYNPASGQPDPRDAEYWANLAKLQATSQQEHAGQLLEQSTADTSYARQLSEAGETRRRGVRDLAESMIGTGLLRSGSHNRRQTEGTIDYTSQLAGWGEEKAGSDARRKAQMDVILSNLGIDELGLYTEASGRYADAQAEAAARQQALDQTAYEASLAASEPAVASGGGRRRRRRRR